MADNNTVVITFQFNAEGQAGVLAIVDAINAKLKQGQEAQAAAPVGEAGGQGSSPLSSIGEHVGIGHGAGQEAAEFGHGIETANKGMELLTRSVESFGRILTTGRLNVAVGGFNQIGESVKGLAAGFGEAGEKVGFMATAVTAAIAAVAGTVTGIKELGEHAAEAVNQFHELADVAGLNSTQFAALQTNFAQFGVGLETVQRLVRLTSVRIQEEWGSLVHSVRTAGDDLTKAQLDVNEAMRRQEGVESAARLAPFGEVQAHENLQEAQARERFAPFGVVRANARLEESKLAIPEADLTSAEAHTNLTEATLRYRKFFEQHPDWAADQDNPQHQIAAQRAEQTFQRSQFAVEHADIKDKETHGVAGGVPEAEEGVRKAQFEEVAAIHGVMEADEGLLKAKRDEAAASDEVTKAAIGVRGALLALKEFPQKNAPALASAIGAGGGGVPWAEVPASDIFRALTLRGVNQTTGLPDLQGVLKSVTEFYNLAGIPQTAKTALGAEIVGGRGGGLPQVIAALTAQAGNKTGIFAETDRSGTLAAGADKFQKPAEDYRAIVANARIDQEKALIGAGGRLIGPAGEIEKGIAAGITTAANAASAGLDLAATSAHSLASSFEELRGTLDWITERGARQTPEYKAALAEHPEVQAAVKKETEARTAVQAYSDQKLSGSGGGAWEERFHALQTDPQYQALQAKANEAAQTSETLQHNLAIKSVPSIAPTVAGLNAPEGTGAGAELKGAGNDLRDAAIQLKQAAASLNGRGTGRSAGGYISGPGTGTSDSIRAPWLSNGEYVVNAARVAEVGVDKLDALNEGKIGFADGGLVDDDHRPKIAGHIPAALEADQSITPRYLALKPEGSLSPGDPSWAESIQQAISERAQRAGVPVEGAERIGSSVRTGAELAPVTGQVLSANEAERSAVRGDYLSAIVNAAGALPVPGAGLAGGAERAAETGIARAIERGGASGEVVAGARGLGATAGLGARADRGRDLSGLEGRGGEASDAGRGGGSDGVRQAQERAAQVAGGQSPLEGLPQKPIKFGDEYYVPGPSAKIRETASAYMASRGAPYSPPTDYVKIDPERGRRLAAAFQEMPNAPDEPAVRDSYSALANETIAQWHAVRDAGLKVEWIKPGQKDPYAGNPRLAARDVSENNHWWGFRTDQGYGSGDATSRAGNPMLADTGEIVDGHPAVVNDLFRVVHDYFGHFKEGVGFRAEGEDNAWHVHASMFSKEALPAMTAETRGQNSWVNFGPYAEANRTATAAETHYAPQKIGVMPAWSYEFRGYGPQAEAEPEKGIIAYHGSPHDFDKFDASYIGTGEGAQAYGYGLYFAGTEGVARDYREKLSGMAPTDSGALHVFKNSGNDLDAAIATARQQTESSNPLIKRNAPAILASLEKWKETGKPPEPNLGHMYQVGINADQEHFLDWDKPLSEQPAAAKQLYNYDPRFIKVTGAEPMGSDLYANIARQSVNGDWGPPGDLAHKLASDRLQQAGIPGIKYLDQGSRFNVASLPQNPITDEAKKWMGGASSSDQAISAFNKAQEAGGYKDWASSERDEIRKVIQKSYETQSRNYVVFDDKTISILKKYAIPAAGLATGAGTLANQSGQPDQSQQPSFSMGGYVQREPYIAGGKIGFADGGLVRGFQEGGEVSDNEDGTGRLEPHSWEKGPHTWENWKDNSKLTDAQYDALKPGEIRGAVTGHFTKTKTAQDYHYVKDADGHLFLVRTGSPRPDVDQSNTDKFNTGNKEVGGHDFSAQGGETTEQWANDPDRSPDGTVRGGWGNTVALARAFGPNWRSYNWGQVQLPSGQWVAQVVHADQVSKTGTGTELPGHDQAHGFQDERELPPRGDLSLAAKDPEHWKVVEVVSDLQGETQKFVIPRNEKATLGEGTEGQQGKPHPEDTKTTPSAASVETAAKIDTPKLPPIELPKGDVKSGPFAPGTSAEKGILQLYTGPEIPGAQHAAAFAPDFVTEAQFEKEMAGAKLPQLDKPKAPEEDASGQARAAGLEKLKAVTPPEQAAPTPPPKPTPTPPVASKIVTPELSAAELAGMSMMPTRGDFTGQGFGGTQAGSTGIKLEDMQPLSGGSHPHPAPTEHHGKRGTDPKATVGDEEKGHAKTGGGAIPEGGTPGPKGAGGAGGAGTGSHGDGRHGHRGERERHTHEREHERHRHEHEHHRVRVHLGDLESGYARTSAEARHIPRSDPLYSPMPGEHHPRGRGDRSLGAGGDSFFAFGGLIQAFQDGGLIGEDGHGDAPSQEITPNVMFALRRGASSSESEPSTSPWVYDHPEHPPSPPKGMGPSGDAKNLAGGFDPFNRRPFGHAGVLKRVPDGRGGVTIYPEFGTALASGGLVKGYQDGGEIEPTFSRNAAKEGEEAIASELFGDVKSISPEEGFQHLMKGAREVTSLGSRFASLAKALGPRVVTKSMGLTGSLLDLVVPDPVPEGTGDLSGRPDLWPKPELETAHAESGFPGMADGGHIRGPGTGTSDEVPIWASDGEFVLKADAVKHWGLDRVEAWNEKRGFAEGGSVSFPSYLSGSSIMGANAAESGMMVSPFSAPPPPSGAFMMQAVNQLNSERGAFSSGMMLGQNSPLSASGLIGASATAPVLSGHYALDVTTDRGTVQVMANEDMISSLAQSALGTKLTKLGITPSWGA